MSTSTLYPPAPAHPSQADDAAFYARMLASLLKENPNLPVLIWSVYPSGLVGRAVGVSDAQVCAVVRRWARVFRAVPQVTSARFVQRYHAVGRVVVVEPGEISARIAKGEYDVRVVGELLDVNLAVEL